MFGSWTISPGQFPLNYFPVDNFQPVSPRQFLADNSLRVTPIFRKISPQTIQTLSKLIAPDSSKLHVYTQSNEP